MDDFGLLRQRMVDNQLRPGSITDHEVLRVFLATPREQFVPASQQALAYSDREIVVPSAGGASRAMMPPAQLARLIQALPRNPEAKILIVACGTGYSAALLSKLVGKVVALEEDATLAAEARTNLKPYPNVVVANGRLAAGYSAEAPYDGVLVEGAIEVMQPGLPKHLKEGGVLVTIERDDRLSRAMLYERVASEATKWPLFDAWGQVLPGFATKREFVF